MPSFNYFHSYNDLLLKSTVFATEPYQVINEDLQWLLAACNEDILLGIGKHLPKHFLNIAESKQYRNDDNKFEVYTVV